MTNPVTGMPGDVRPPSVGVDVGGTFTDVVLIDTDSHRHTAKVPTTNPPDVGVIEGIEQVCATAGIEPASITTFRHGTTVATNALLTRDGAKTALVTTEGFRDVLEIGRQNRPALYDLEADRPVPLVPRRHRFELVERTPPPAGAVAKGRRITPDPEDVEQLGHTLSTADVKSVAISFLHAYADAHHEETVAEALRQRVGIPVIASHDILPEFREYERTATTVASAYLTPVIDDYLDRLETRCAEQGIAIPQLMQSNGGITTPRQARARAVTTVLSGPAAGVVGASSLAGGGAGGTAGLITIDMGGTSADVSLIEEGRPERTTETTIGGVPVRVPTVDVTTVGAGGGSIAWVDDGGALRVGPDSAGADPGPACYHRGGTEATVTDAAVGLGLIGAGTRLGGRIEIHRQAAVEVLESIATDADLAGATEAAQGIYRVANATMTRAIRSVTIERGRDPRDMRLVAFGGAGGMHATALAEQLGIGHITIPLDGGVLSADGLLHADEIHDVVRTAPTPLEGDVHQELAPILDAIEAEVIERCSDPTRTETGFELDLRYKGQSFELTVPVERPIDRDGLEATFHQSHEQERGYRLDGAIEIVSCRVRAIVRNDPMHTEEHPSQIEQVGVRSVVLHEGMEETPYTIYRGLPGKPTQLEAPCILERPESTVVIPTGWHATSVVDGMLSLRRGGSP